MGELLSTIGQVKNNWKNYESWEEEQDKREIAKKKHFQSKPASEQEKADAKKLGSTIIRAVNIMDEYSEDKAEDMENATTAATNMVVQTTGIIGGAIGVMAGMRVAGGKYTFPISTLAGTIVGIASFIPMSAISTKAQVMASKVARFQAREQELKAPENFVIYTPEQMSQAKEIAATLPDEKEKSNKAGTFFPLIDSIKTIQSISKDKNAYKEWRKQYEQDEKEIKTSYQKGIPADKLQKAKQDQQIITNIVKKINLEAEEYSENIENATDTVGVFAEWGITGAVGTATHFVLNKIKLAPESFVAKHTKWVSGMVALVPLLSLATYFTLLQKDAARVGRFKAKQELLSNPENFIYEDDKTLNNEAKNVGNVSSNDKKGFFSGINRLMEAHKLRKEYKQYKKTKALEDKKLRKALSQIKVSDEQLINAKNLQEKTFNAFEKIDDMSQKYSETMEMATDIGKQSVPSLAWLGLVGVGTGLFMYAEKKFGKMSLPQIIEKTIKIYDKVTKIIKPIAKKPFVKKFLTKAQNEMGEVSLNILSKNLRGQSIDFGTILVEAIKKPTLAKIMVGAGLPILGGVVGFIYATNSYFTKLQKKAGKIGIMKAMQELDDPRYFVDKYSDGKQAKPTQQNNETKTTNSALQRLLEIRKIA